MQRAVGNRVQQTVATDVTRYLLDLQPGLAVVLAATKGTETIRYVHSLRGIHAQKDPQNEWDWMVQDGLGSVRGVVNNTADMLESRLYNPYGGTVTSSPYGYGETDYGFTGELTDDNGLLYLRARYYSPNSGAFASLDPFEGMVDRPMSLNGYSYVEGNPINWTDASGEQTGVLEGAALLCLSNPAACAVAIGISYMLGLALAKSYQENPDMLNSIIESVTGTCTTTLRQAGTSLSQLGTLGAYYGFKTLNDASVTAQQLLAIIAYHTGINSSAGTAAISIPVPEKCMRGECTDYVTNLLDHLAELSVATLAALATEFTIYGDGGKIAPAGIQDVSARSVDPSHPIYPYVISINGTVISWPAVAFDPNSGSFVTRGNRAAVHIYMAFGLGAISKVYDNIHPGGNGDINTYHSSLTGVEWRDCRKYRGLTPENIAKALTILPVLVIEAQGPGRLSASNNLGGVCPLG